MLLPSVAPFVALLLLLSVRIRLRRADLLWWVGAVLVAAPEAIHGAVWTASGTFLQVVAGWLIYRAIADVAAAEATARRIRNLEAGLLVGMTILVAAHVGSWSGLSMVGTAVAATLPGASSPVLFAHSVLVLAGLVLVVSRHRALRWPAVAVAGLGILASGHLVAALAWLALAAGAAWLVHADGPRGRVYEMLAATLAVTVVASFMWLSGPVAIEATAGSHGESAVAPHMAWTTAWAGVRERPLLGWGPDSFADHYVGRHTEGSSLLSTPEHAHNQYLHSAFEGGVIGAVGLFFVIGALIHAALRRRDALFLTLVGTVLFVNVFDTSLFYGAVFYPLVAAAGWRATAARDSRAGTEEPERNVAARMGLAIGDVVAVGLAWFVAVRANGILSGVPAASEPWFDQVGPIGAYVLLLWPLLSWREGLFPGYGLTPQQELKKQATVAVTAGVLLIALLVAAPAMVSVPASVVVTMVVASLVSLPLSRAATKRILHAFAMWGRPLIILGAGPLGQRIARSMQRTPLDGLQPVAMFDDEVRTHGQHHGGVPVVGSLKDAAPFARARGIGHAIVAIPSLDADHVRSVLDTKDKPFRSVEFVPDLAGFPAEVVSAASLDGMLTLQVRNNLASRTNRFFKRSLDLCGGAISLLLLAPLLLALAVWIRVDSRGPVLYRSERVGESGRIFSCFKFRTMTENAEAQLQDLMARDSAIRQEYQRFHKLARDPRVTRVGRVLRSFSLDELPQLFNVMMGQMSLVGPRPYLARELTVMGPMRDVILQAKPGMTGYWQVSERNDVTFQDRLEMEAHYVRNWSIWWDIVILARTPSAVIQKRGH